ncbi:hypothetical protein CALCODRAFT_519654 [Calocera cornea HHB12733]|uniref:Ubiquitin-like domain-containing protein n=1 Tax=Calocera cornea HHB12733 TaxID=1353952 RepID=A0A165E3J9_9BASI|nr:hypothetical protein CALCODRAFT_519654 [Calocera cornea HHB12733]
MARSVQDRVPDSDDETNQATNSEEDRSQMTRSAGPAHRSTESRQAREPANSRYEPSSDPASQVPRQKTAVTVKIGEEEMKFNLSRSIPFWRVFSKVENKFRMQPDTLRFLYDEVRIGKDDTVASLNLEDDAVIEAHLEQVGGA